MAHRSKKHSEIHPVAPPESDASPASVNAAQALHREIAEAAYYRAQTRGFAPGGEVQDWLAAEQDVLSSSRTA
jgi:hypothetical protein